MSSFAGPNETDPIFVQLVGVVTEARRLGAGLALLTATAERDPLRDIAMATLDENIQARALNERFAGSIGAPHRRVPPAPIRTAVSESDAAMSIVSRSSSGHRRSFSDGSCPDE